MVKRERVDVRGQSSAPLVDESPALRVSPVKPSSPAYISRLEPTINGFSSVSAPVKLSEAQKSENSAGLLFIGTTSRIVISLNPTSVTSLMHLIFC